MRNDRGLALGGVEVALTLNAEGLKEIARGKII